MFTQLFFRFSPILRYTVIGKSMYPTFKEGETLFATKLLFRKLKTGEVVIAKDPRTKRPLLKRIKSVKNNQYFLVGDNEKESTDSRLFGCIGRKAIVGKVFLTMYQ